jgi:hypothetical protein
VGPPCPNSLLCRPQQGRGATLHSPPASEPPRACLAMPASNATELNCSLAGGSGPAKTPQAGGLTVMARAATKGGACLLQAHKAGRSVVVLRLQLRCRLPRCVSLRPSCGATASGQPLDARCRARMQHTLARNTARMPHLCSQWCLLLGVAITLAAVQLPPALAEAPPAMSSPRGLRLLSAAEAAALDTALMTQPGFSIDQLMELAGVCAMRRHR